MTTAETRQEKKYKNFKKSGTINIFWYLRNSRVENNPIYVPQGNH